MEKLLAVGCGGFLGALLRYAMISWVPRLQYFQDWPIPVGTLAVNLLGCGAIGFLKALADSVAWMTPTTSLFLFTGLLGSFTTFSTFGFEGWQLLESGKPLPLLAYVALSVILGLILVWAGHVLGTRLVQNP